MRWKNRAIQKGFSLLLSAAMVAQMLPATAGAVKASRADERAAVDSSDMTLEYAKIDDTSGKLWIGSIGETVFDEITYSIGDEERSDAVTR